MSEICSFGDEAHLEFKGLFGKCFRFLFWFRDFLLY
jgi:hypothetical protein